MVLRSLIHDSQMWDHYTYDSHLWDIQIECYAMLWRMPKRSEGVPEEYKTYRLALGREIGARIQAQRRHLALSQEDVRAQMELQNVHVSRSQYSRIETGESIPDAVQIVALVQVLNTSSDWLLFGQEMQKPTR